MNSFISSRSQCGSNSHMHARHRFCAANVAYLYSAFQVGRIPLLKGTSAVRSEINLWQFFAAEKSLLVVSISSGKAFCVGDERV